MSYIAGGYTFGYFPELNPLNVRYALLDAGVASPDFATACELGFGQGLSVNIHSAAGATQWYGTDFSSEMAGFAQEGAKASGNQAQLFDQDFASFALRDDLPDFDFIALHGIWAWISPADRKVLLDFIDRKLKVGGVVYLSYNTQAGWATMSPVRELIYRYVKQLQPTGLSAVAKVEKALDFVEQWFATNPLFVQQNPQVTEVFNFIKSQNLNYLAHEYLTDSWNAFSFAEVAQDLEGIKLDFVCSANGLDSVAALNMTVAQQEFIEKLDDLQVQEVVKDLTTNQQFRKDYWVKGRRNLDKFEQMEQMMALPLVLTQLPEEVELSATGALGTLGLKAETYQPIIDFFADYQVKTLEDFARSHPQVGVDKLFQAIRILTAQNVLSVAQVGVVSEESSQKLNSYLMQKARASNEITYLASPVTGGGIYLPANEMLFALAQAFGQKDAQAIANFAWGLLKAQGINLQQNGRDLETDAENISLLTEQAEFFLAKPNEIYRSLGLFN